MENIKLILKNNCIRLLNRQNIGMSLKELSRQMQVSEATIHRWKSGESSPELNNIERLSDLLGISPLEFFKKEPNGTEIIQLPPGVREFGEIVKKASMLSTENLRRLSEEIDDLLEIQEEEIQERKSQA